MGRGFARENTCPVWEVINGVIVTYRRMGNKSKPPPLHQEGHHIFGALLNLRPTTQLLAMGLI